MKKAIETPFHFFISFSIINIFILFNLLLFMKDKIMQVITYQYSNMGDFWGLFYVMDLKNGEYFDNYPPLAYVFLKFFFSLVGRNEGDIMSYENTSLVYVLYLTLFFVLFYIILDFYVIQEKKLKNMIFFILSVSYPIFWCGVERGNMVLYSALFLIAGYFLSQSDSKIKKEIGLILIAFSADMKVYPAVIGLLFLVDKKYKEAIRLIIYGLLFFIIPLMMLNTNFSAFYDSTFALTVGRGIYSKTSIVGNCVLLFGEEGVAFGWILTIIWMIWVAIYVFVEKERWKCLVMIISIMTIIIPESYIYNYIFIVLPLIIFFNKKDEFCKIDYVYAALFALIFTCPPLVFISSGVMIGIYFSWIIMLLLVSVEKIKDFVTCICNKRKVSA